MAKKKGPSPAKVKEAAQAYLKRLEKYLKSEGEFIMPEWDAAVKKAYGKFKPILLTTKKKRYFISEMMFRPNDVGDVYTNSGMPVAQNGKIGISVGPLALKPFFSMLKRYGAYKDVIGKLKKYKAYREYIKKYGGGNKSRIERLYDDGFSKLAA